MTVNAAEVTSFFDAFPVHVRERVALLDGVLHISDDLRGDSELMARKGKLRRHGIIQCEFHQHSVVFENYSYAKTRSALGENIIE